MAGKMPKMPFKEFRNMPESLTPFDEAIALNPSIHPLFHSDRGFQYTSKTFYAKLEESHIRQSMSRVGRYVGNGPIEGFWAYLNLKCTI